MNEPVITWYIVATVLGGFSLACCGLLWHIFSDRIKKQEKSSRIIARYLIFYATPEQKEYLRDLLDGLLNGD